MNVNGFCWRLTSCLSRTLDSQERDAVLGDLMECESSPAEALFDLAGLVARRQGKVLIDARFWRILVLVIVPLSLMLSLISQLVCESTSVAAWFYISNWTPGYLAIGFRQDLASEFGSLVVSWITLACWAWTSGLVIGRYLRRAAWLGGTLLFLFMSLANVAVMASSSGETLSLLVYRRCFLAAIVALLVLTPALVGILSGVRLSLWPNWERRILSVCMLAAMIALFIDCLGPHALRKPFYPSLACLSPIAWKVMSRRFRRLSYEVI